MSILTSHITTNPFGKEDECALFTVEDVQEQFTIFDVTTEGQKYTFNCWLKSDSDGLLTIHGITIATTPQWQQHTVTFVAEGTDVVIDYDAVGVYYIYHPKLELGTLSTDWTPAPEDAEDAIRDVANAASNAQSTADSAEQRVAIAETLIQQLSDSISMLVTDGAGGSLMKQTANGWTFSMAETKEQLYDLSELLNTANTNIGDTAALVDALRGSVDKLGETANYVQIKLDGDQPYIILGEENSDFKVVITNTEIRFMEGSNVPAYISNQSLHIKKAVIEEELQQGGFVWTVRSNGNMGLIWKGATG